MEPQSAQKTDQQGATIETVDQECYEQSLFPKPFIRFDFSELIGFLF